MKTALIFLVSRILLLLLFGITIDIWFWNSMIVIHVHYTYFVIAHWSAIIAIILILGTFSSLGGIIGTRFHNKFFLIAFALYCS